MIDEADDSVFLMNRFYGEKIILPMIECVRKEFAGDVGLTVARRLEKEMLEKNGFIRGDDLVELLKDGLGLECAVSLIGQMDRSEKWGCTGTGSSRACRNHLLKHRFFQMACPKNGSVNR